MLNYSAPGKLFISGEWAILEVGNHGLVAAVNNRVHVSLEGTLEDILITAAEFGVREVHAKYAEGKLHIDADDKQKETLKLLGEALSTSLKFLGENSIMPKPFHIITSSKDTQFEVSGQLKKVGFGSSAALVVSAIAAVLDFHGYRSTKEEIYKLSTIAHYYAQGKVGSAFDVAASTYGGLFVYSRFDPDWLTKKVESGEPLAQIVREKWPSLIIEELSIPENFHLLVGWTGDSASTSAAIKQMNEFKAANREKYDELMDSIADIAEGAIESFREENWEKFFIVLNKNEELLRELGETSKVNIETPELKKLSEIASDYGAVGKLSGAGGGDCGIGICFDDVTANNVMAAWGDEGLKPLDVTIDRDGVKKD